VSRRVIAPATCRELHSSVSAPIGTKPQLRKARSDAAYLDGLR